MKTLIKNATVVLPSGSAQTSILLDGGVIADVDPAIQTVAETTVDATGLYLLPGVIDDQVHFREPGLTHKEDFAHATRACAKGGVTSFLEMPNTDPTTTTCERLYEKLALADTKCLVNYGFYIGATVDNIQELKSARRTPGIKIFIGSSTGDLLVDEQQALEAIFAETDLPLTAHCEDEATIKRNAKRFVHSSNVRDHSNIRDHAAAIRATRRAVDLAKRHNHRFHVLHVSTGDEINLFRDHRDIITAEVCPHHLFFNVADYARLGSRIKMNPSVKTPADNQRLWNALLEGTIQIIATDHAPHTLEEKAKPFPDCPSGLPAVENSLALMLDQVNRGLCTIEQVVHWMCEGPALVWDIVNKGRIERGFDADLVLVDMEMSLTVLDKNQLTKCKWSPWHGQALQGWPVRTFVMGKEVFRRENNQVSLAQQPHGHEIKFEHERGGYWKNCQKATTV
jgi:dihydroorotase